MNTNDEKLLKVKKIANEILKLSDDISYLVSEQEKLMNEIKVADGIWKPEQSKDKGKI